MSSSVGKKIASDAIRHRQRAPFFAWWRDFLLGAKNRTSTHEVPPSDWKPTTFQNPVRFPSSQSTRSPEAPNIPGGVHHKLADNYYYEHDARRMVEPPKVIYKAEDVERLEGPDVTQLAAAAVQTSQQGGVPSEARSVTEAMGVLKGPQENFGLFSIPTPGFGIEWRRNRAEEQETQREDPLLEMTERFDRYKPTRA